MISIAGVTLPTSAVWANEQRYGMPSSSVVTDADGYTHTYRGSACADIDIYIPNVRDGLTRESAETLRELAQSMAQVAVIMGEKTMTAVFRYSEDPLELSPVTKKQTYDPTDIYYGTIRLTEV